MPTNNPNEDPLVKYANSPEAASTYSPTITASSLSSTTTPNFAAPNPTAHAIPYTPPAALTGMEGVAQDLTSKLQGLNEQNTGQAVFRTQQENTYDITGKTQTVNDLTNQLNDIKAQYDAVPLQMQNQAEGRGITAGGLAPLTQAEQNKLAIRSLGVGALLQAAQGNLATAQSLVERSVKAKFDPIQEQITATTNNLNLILNSPQYSLEQKNRAQQQLDIQNAKQAQLDQQKATQQAVGKIAISAAQNLNNFTPTPEYQTAAQAIQAIQSAQSEADATAIAVETGMVVPEKLNTSIVEVAGRKLLIDNQTGTTIKDLGSTASVGSIANLTPEQQKNPFIALLARSAGGKRLTDTSVQKLDKAIGVLGQLGSLQSNIANTNTGPIAGLFRGANPWDTNAQVIKAQLNAIVPNLARGVYGEVGVLTDNDIKTYSQTLPNLRSTEDVRNAVLGITIDLVAKSVKRTLEVNAANKADVSGYIDLYTEMVDTRNSIFSQIPGYKGEGALSLADSGVTPDEEKAFNAVLGITDTSTSQNTTGGISSFFNDIWKGIIGQ